MPQLSEARATSVATLVEFFGLAINSVLFHRGVYPASYFLPVSVGGLSAVVARDEQLKRYLGGVLSQIAEWVTARVLRRFVLLIVSRDSHEVIERWSFHVSSVSDNRDSRSAVDDEMSRGAVLRQIASSSSFLPVFNNPVAFDLLVYSSANCDIPVSWETTQSLVVPDVARVALRSFDTTDHHVETSVFFVE